MTAAIEVRPGMEAPVPGSCSDGGEHGGDVVARDLAAADGVASLTRPVPGSSVSRPGRTIV